MAVFTVSPTYPNARLDLAARRQDPSEALSKEFLDRTTPRRPLVGKCLFPHDSPIYRA